MKVFSVYLRIFKKNKVHFILSFAIFLFFSVLFTMATPEKSFEFAETKTDITIINCDGDTELITGLKNYISNYANFKDTEEAQIEDALYYREIFLAIIIPEGFTDMFLNKEDVKLIEYSIPDAPYIITVKHAINKYLDTVKLYLNNTTEPLTDILNIVTDDLTKTIEVELTNTDDNKAIGAVYYFNFLWYFFIVVILTIVGVVMISFRQKYVFQRNTVSPISQVKLNLQLIMSHLLFTFIIFILMIGFSYIFYYKDMTGSRAIYFILNAFCLNVSVVSLSYMISLLIKKRETLMALVNVIGLSTSFISGAFVPQWVLGKGVLTTARLFPSYYYIANNNLIGNSNDLSSSAISRLILYMIIQLLFAVVFVIISIFINKKQLTEEA